VLPERIVTRRLVLRRGRREDAPLLKRAIDANLDHLRAWMPWAMEEPSPLEVIEERLIRFASDFDAAADWAFGIFPPDESAVIGGAGIHRRTEPDTLEIGYWIDARHTRRGYATEATEALMRFGFSMPEIERIEIRCDPRNIASAGVPKKLGFRHIATLENDTTTPTGDPRDTMVWEMTRPSFDLQRATLESFQ
jgi:RimJ/RimL family protein N-acetyltransferase